jgi:methyl-accepting chemotaxis protein
MDDVTQQNLALVEKAATGAESLKQQVDMLSKTVANFNI